MVGAEMLTNGREEYQMTPGDWRGDRTESDPVMPEGFMLAVCCLTLSLFISLKGSLQGLSKDHLFKKSSLMRKH